MLNVDIGTPARFDALDKLQEHWGCLTRSETVRRLIDWAGEMQRPPEQHLQPAHRERPAMAIGGGRFKL